MHILHSKDFSNEDGAKIIYEDLYGVSDYTKVVVVASLMALSAPKGVLTRELPVVIANQFHENYSAKIEAAVKSMGKEYVQHTSQATYLAARIVAGISDTLIQGFIGVGKDLIELALTNPSLSEISSPLEDISTEDHWTLFNYVDMVYASVIEEHLKLGLWPNGKDEWKKSIVDTWPSISGELLDEIYRLAHSVYDRFTEGNIDAVTDFENEGLVNLGQYAITGKDSRLLANHKKTEEVYVKVALKIIANSVTQPYCKECVGKILRNFMWVNL